MSRYIDADKAKNGIMKFVNEYGEIVGMFVNDFNILLERCAVDVQEVRHGHWIDVNGDGRIFECSACGGISCCNAAYCNECGAKMEERE